MRSSKRLRDCAIILPLFGELSSCASRCASAFMLPCSDCSRSRSAASPPARISVLIAPRLSSRLRARARSVRDSLGEISTDIRVGVDATLLEREQSLHGSINAEAQRLAQL